MPHIKTAFVPDSAIESVWLRTPWDICDELVGIHGDDIRAFHHQVKHVDEPIKGIHLTVTALFHREPGPEQE